MHTAEIRKENCRLAITRGTDRPGAHAPGEGFSYVSEGHENGILDRDAVIEIG